MVQVANNDYCEIYDVQYPKEPLMLNDIYHIDMNVLIDLVAYDHPMYYYCTRSFYNFGDNVPDQRQNIGDILSAFVTSYARAHGLVQTYYLSRMNGITFAGIDVLDGRYDEYQAEDANGKFDMLCDCAFEADIYQLALSYEFVNDECQLDVAYVAVMNLIKWKDFLELIDMPVNQYPTDLEIQQINAAFIDRVP